MTCSLVYCMRRCKSVVNDTCHILITGTQRLDGQQFANPYSRDTGLR
jgi:hypothetical protein